MCAIPTASDVAPPARPNSVCSPISWARAPIWSGVTVNPQVRMTSAAACALPPRLASGALMAK
jgi:hypothetical protein